MSVFLSTPRLVLREFTPDDADLLVELDGDPEVMRYLTGGRPTPPEAVRERVLPRILAHYRRAPGLGWWAAQDRGSGAFLGWFEFRPTRDGDAWEVELGYRLRRAAWGAGLATEGCRALIDKGFAELDVRRVTANTMTVNAASRRVMEKSGLRLVRTYVGDWPELIDGAEHGEVEYALTREHWLRRDAD
ncbi:Protein N-acetyltransferase, RimJ/RimL family [Micromonospora echinofusca]|uniref:Protein N-acetyltransferase, RimJ/RimL family n=1 Tax=Micromonospora echinofusca TaxID=47858 RepID=A0A1C5G8R3_MICEH|nr:GNAT family N-acetyltransferase [Micromonospora echinofusca]SCG16078.1 Protein N-acetyltransferase, RimJ/RimL family [Micromonospora echinofusca]